MLLHRSDARKIDWSCVEAWMLWVQFCITFGGKSDGEKDRALDPSTALRMTEAEGILADWIPAYAGITGERN